MEGPKRFRRRIYLIKTWFQLKYIGLILLFMFVVAWLAGSTVYYTAWLLMGERLANVYPQGRLVAIMRTIDAALMLRLMFIVPIVILLSLLVSHRIAGPLFSIERFLKSVAKGNLGARLRLRKNDELQDLAEAINEMTDDLKNRVNMLKRIANMASLELEKLRRDLGSQAPDINLVKSEVGDLAESIKELEDHLSEYRLTAVED